MNEFIPFQNSKNEENWNGGKGEENELLVLKIFRSTIKDQEEANHFPSLFVPFHEINLSVSSSDFTSKSFHFLILYLM